MEPLVKHAEAGDLTAHFPTGHEEAGSILRLLLETLAQNAVSGSGSVEAVDCAMVMRSIIGTTRVDLSGARTVACKSSSPELLKVLFSESVSVRDATQALQDVARHAAVDAVAGMIKVLLALPTPPSLTDNRAGGDSVIGSLVRRGATDAVMALLEVRDAEGRPTALVADRSQESGGPRSRGGRRRGKERSTSLLAVVDDCVKTWERSGANRTAVPPLQCVQPLSAIVSASKSGPFDLLRSASVCRDNERAARLLVSITGLDGIVKYAKSAFESGGDRGVVRRLHELVAVVDNSGGAQAFTGAPVASVGTAAGHGVSALSDESVSFILSSVLRARSSPKEIRTWGVVLAELTVADHLMDKRRTAGEDDAAAPLFPVARDVISDELLTSWASFTARMGMGVLFDVAGELDAEDDDDEDEDESGEEGVARFSSLFGSLVLLYAASRIQRTDQLSETGTTDAVEVMDGAGGAGGPPPPAFPTTKGLPELPGPSHWRTITAPLMPLWRLMVTALSLVHGDLDVCSPYRLASVVRAFSVWNMVADAATRTGQAGTGAAKSAWGADTGNGGAMAAVVKAALGKWAADDAYKRFVPPDVNGEVAWSRDKGLRLQPAPALLNVLCRNFDVPEAISSFLQDHATALRRFMRDDDELLGEELAFLLNIPNVVRGEDKLDHIRQAIGFRGSDGSLQFVVDRGHLLSSLEVVLQQMLAAPGHQLRKELSVSFVDEPGIGEGPAREFVDLLCRALVSDNTESATETKDAVDTSSDGPGGGGGAATGDTRRRFPAAPASGPDGVSLLEWALPLFVPASDGGVFVIRSNDAVEGLRPPSPAGDEGAAEAAARNSTARCSCFAAVGRLMGTCLLRDTPLGLRLGKGLCKLLLADCELDAEDVADLDEAVASSMAKLRILDLDAGDVPDLTFQTPATAACAVPSEADRTDCELCPDGATRRVTNANADEFIKLKARHLAISGAEAELNAMRDGLRAVVQPKFLKMLSGDELQRILLGPQFIDLASWKRATEYEGYSENSQPVKWFWQAVSEKLDEQRRRRLLLFWSGTSLPPVFGFKKASLDVNFNIERLHSSGCPTASTCDRLLRLPAYRSYEELCSKLLIAIDIGAEGYGSA